MKSYGYPFDVTQRDRWHPVLRINDEMRFTRRKELFVIGMWFAWRALFPRRVK